MNEREADKYVKKDNIWKKPNYQAMLDDGIPIGVVYYIKKVRDAVPASPRYYRAYNYEEKSYQQKRYIDTVRQLQKVMEKVRTVEDAKNAFVDFYIRNAYLRSVREWDGRTAYERTSDYSHNPALTDNLRNVIKISSDVQFEYDFVRKAKSEQFLVPKEQKVPRGYDIHLYDGKGYSRSGDWKKDTYYVTKGHHILQTNFETRDQALRWVQEYAKSRTKSGKQRFVPPQLEHITRTGPDFRNGQEITGQHYLDAFGFRGGEFGNWLNQNDRQASLNMGFEALKDLAAALHISDKDIAFDGTLAIAFGARGSGNAAAHYEPLRKVINLTKMHGAGSLAHEWWHALDDYLGGIKGANGMLSERARRYEPMRKLIEAITTKPETYEQAKARTERNNEIQIKNATSWVDSLMKRSVERANDPAISEQYAAAKAAFLVGAEGSVDRLSNLKKQITGHVIPKDDRQNLQYYENRMRDIQNQSEPVIGRVQTDYYKNSKRMGKTTEKDGGYWDSEVEMTARAFACYVKDKLSYQSDYLVGHAESCLGLDTDKDGKMQIIKAYPEGEERKSINAAFDNLIAELKKELVFTHTEKTPSLPLAKTQTAQQLSMFGEDKPSVLGQLAAAKAAPKPHSSPAKKQEQSL
ncbi:MAG: hypothetical protein IIZ07_03415 [Ruminococcus sp.]|nr:hypothetical protein [Ruminococcus sp.]